ncbi:MAG TPA: PqqD family protein [Acidimicrobiales bacterium]|nr:PqqD family protein [Acidimicrobiales bacterium]
MQGEVVALDVGRSVYVATNVAGAVLWSRLSEGATRQDLARALVDEFDVADHTAEADVDRFLDRLHELDLIEGQP